MTAYGNLVIFNFSQLNFTFPSISWLYECQVDVLVVVNMNVVLHRRGRFFLNSWMQPECMSHALCHAAELQSLHVLLYYIRILTTCTLSARIYLMRDDVIKETFLSVSEFTCVCGVHFAPHVRMYL